MRDTAAARANRRSPHHCSPPKRAKPLPLPSPYCALAGYMLLRPMETVSAQTMDAASTQKTKLVRRHSSGTMPRTYIGSQTLSSSLIHYQLLVKWPQAITHSFHKSKKSRPRRQPRRTMASKMGRSKILRCSTGPRLHDLFSSCRDAHGLTHGRRIHSPHLSHFSGHASSDNSWVLSRPVDCIRTLILSLLALLISVVQALSLGYLLMN